MLMKKVRFDEMCCALNSSLHMVSDLRISIQTNGMLVDQEWIQLFSKHKIFVGVSIDGPEEDHNKYRVDHQGRGTYEATIKGLSLLKSAVKSGELSGIGILCVINPQRDAANILSHFVDELGIKSLHFILPDFNHDSFNKEDLPNYSKFLIDLFDAWIKYDDPEIEIRLLSNALTLLTNGSSYLKKYNEINRRFIAFTVASNGDIGPDDDLRNIARSLFNTGANVANISLAEYLTMSETRKLAAETKIPAKDCVSCCWLNICEQGSMFGSPVHNYSMVNQFGNSSIYCNAIQDLFIHATRYLVGQGFSFERISEILVKQ